VFSQRALPIVLKIIIRKSSRHIETEEKQLYVRLVSEGSRHAPFQHEWMFRLGNAFAGGMQTRP